MRRFVWESFVWNRQPKYRTIHRNSILIHGKKLWFLANVIISCQRVYAVLPKMNSINQSIVKFGLLLSLSGHYYSECIVIVFRMGKFANALLKHQINIFTLELLIIVWDQNLGLIVNKINKIFRKSNLDWIFICWIQWIQRRFMWIVCQIPTPKVNQRLKKIKQAKAL